MQTKNFTKTKLNKAISAVCSDVSLGDTSGWGDDCGEGPVIEGGESDPSDHQASGQQPPSHVASAVHGSLRSQLPESRQVHYY